MTDRRQEEMLRRAVMRGMTQRRYSRRDMLKYAGVGAGALSFASVLAACSVKGAKQEEQGLQPLPPSAGQLDVANWPLYIDKDGKDADGNIKSGSLSGFEKATGVAINYKEAINDNEEFFGTQLRAQLGNGQASDWDMIVMTDWMIAKLIRLGFLEQLHQEKLPNVTANVDDKFKDPWFDPGNVHSYPWAAGLTGIGYDRNKTGRDITSINDLFDPEFTGHVGMFQEMRDTFNFIFLKNDIDPVTATLADAEAAQKELIDQRPLVRGYYGNDYTDQLAGGNLWVTMAWSGDIFALALDQSDDQDLRWILPDEGGNRWSDNMAIPRMAAHPTDAHEWMNYVYQPEVATNITEFVWYESPVKGVQQMIEADGVDKPNMAKLASDPFVWPSEEVLANAYPYKNLTAEEEAAWQDLFDSVILG